MKLLLIWGGAVILALYPLIIYLGLHIFNARSLALIMLTLILIRFYALGSNAKQLPWLKAVPLIGAVTILASLLTEDTLGIKLYPLAINLGMLILFAYSLLKGPSVIETLARLQHPQLDQNGIGYTRKVTQVWCVFFCLNMTVSAYTAFFSTMELWALYNGIIAYLAMALLFAGEWLVRQKHIKN
jgi:uncharacterized membrane protein